MDEQDLALKQLHQLSIKIEKQPQPQSQTPPPSIPNQIQPKISHFTRELNLFYCDFYLNSEVSLKIVLTSQLDASIYQLLITKQSKKQQEELNFFESIDEIYDYLYQNSHEEGTKVKQQVVKIGENGKLSMIVISTIGKKQRHRTIILQPIKITQNKQIYLQNVIKKIGKNVLELKKEISTIHQDYTNTQKINKQLLQKLNQYGCHFSFIADKTDTHYNKFKEIDKRYTKIIDNTTYFSIFSDKSLPKNQNIYFNVKLGNTQGRNIMIGISSKFTKGIPNVYSHQDFIGFYLYQSGYIWENSNQREIGVLGTNGGFPIGVGSIITTNVNLSMGYINWEICGVRVGYAVIPQELKAKLLFAVVLMINVNDCIEIDP